MSSLEDTLDIHILKWYQKLSFLFEDRVYVFCVHRVATALEIAFKAEGSSLRRVKEKASLKTWLLFFVSELVFDLH
jgi:hypothetical protein